MNMNGPRLIGLALGVVLAGVAAAVALELVGSYQRTGDVGYLTLLAALSGTGLLLLKAYTHFAQRLGRGDPDLLERVAELEARLEEVERRGLTSGEVEQVYAQFAEMDSRMEFTERLLATRDGIVPRTGATE